MKRRIWLIFALSWTFALLLMWFIIFLWGTIQGYAILYFPFNEAPLELVLTAIALPAILLLLIDEVRDWYYRR